MRLAFLTALLAALAMPGPAFAAQADAPALAGTSWRVLAYDNGKGGVVRVVGGSELSAVFGSDGRLSGSAGCNRYSAGYALDGGALEIGPAMATRMACAEPEGVMEQEAAFLAALATAARYEIRGDRLQLRTPTGSPAVDLVSESSAVSAGSGAGQSAPGESSQPSSRPSPRSVVESFHAALLDSMKRSEALGFDGRVERIAESLDETFDIPRMARVVSRRWRGLGSGGRERWVALLRRYWASRYAHRYSSFSGQSFEILGEEPGENDTATIRVGVVQPGEDTVELGYTLRKADGVWRIVDVEEGDVSEVWLLKEHYRAVAANRGAETFLTEMSQKVEELGRD